MANYAQIQGLKELQEALDQLPGKVQGNIMRGALRAGAKVIAEQARDNLEKAGHVRTGKLAESVRVGTKSKAGTVSASVKAGKRGKGANSIFWAHFIEGGTAAHVIKAKPPNKALAIGVAKVEHPGIKKSPFMRPAMDQRAVEAIEVAREYVRNRLATKHGLDVPAPMVEGDE